MSLAWDIAGSAARRLMQAREGAAEVLDAGGGRGRMRQRSMIVAALGETTGFRTARDLHQALRARSERTRLATVDRVLHALAEAGEVDVIRSASRGEMLYRRCSAGHHHHLICRRCGSVAEIISTGLQRRIARIAAEHGYRDISHQFEITGICPGCAAAAGER